MVHHERVLDNGSVVEVTYDGEIWWVGRHDSEHEPARVPFTDDQLTALRECIVDAQQDPGF